MKYLKLTDSPNPTNPFDGNPYVYYNKYIDKVWIFLGLKWILRDGYWDMDGQWADEGIWNMISHGQYQQQ